MKKFEVNNFYYHQGNIGPINFELPAEKIIGISGSSGCGKSLLLRALADLDNNTGSVILDGIDKNSLNAPEWRLKVALVAAESQWWFDTLGEHFNQDDASLNENLQALGFNENVVDWSVSRLSSGEKQRMSLLRSLQNKPEVLLLDEPTANLDSHNTQVFEDFIKQYSTKYKLAVIWVSHDLQQIARLCDEHYELKNAELKQC